MESPGGHYWVGTQEQKIDNAATTCIYLTAILLRKIAADFAKHESAMAFIKTQNWAKLTQEGNFSYLYKSKSKKKYLEAYIICSYTL